MFINFRTEAFKLLIFPNLLKPDKMTNERISHSCDDLPCTPKRVIDSILQDLALAERFLSICGCKIPKRTPVIVSPFLVYRDEDVFPDQRNGSLEMEESPGVSHSEKLLPSLSGLERPSASVARLKVPIVSTRPHQVPTQIIVMEFPIVH
ncbi:hypothetical protein CEXT_145061 [Caerostris extrusa]|uniref:Uncharacterized protein n=1 Tax=Caerostris extrusa TaxID=172846 RepID=A0AAV4PYS4_CAEEX|nr:hypothetical protein CEXT_145061 [Caerostris extrusa]